MTEPEIIKIEDPFIGSRAGRRRQRLFFIAAIGGIAILAGVLYLNSLRNMFTNWDDGMIYSNPGIQSLSWENVIKLFTPVRRETYQPVRILSYAIDYHFWKLDPMGYHITNVLFYILTCIMVLFSLQKLSAHLRPEGAPGSHERVALLGGLLFAAHPVHVESVTWLAARKEVLQGFFFFLAFYFYLRGREEEGKKRNIYLGFVLLSFLLAVLSKPSAVVFPGVILLYEISREREKFFLFFKSYWLFLILSIVVSALFTFILMKVMIESGGIKPYYGDTFLKNFMVCVYVFLRSIRLLFFHLHYSAAYSFSMVLPVFCLKNVLAICIAIFLLGISILSLRWTRVLFFSFFFFLIALLPFLNIFPISTLLADRYLFLASFSYAFLLGVFFEKVYSFQQSRVSKDFFKLVAAVVFVFLLTGYSVMTIGQNTVWHDSYSLWSDAVEKSPESNTANAMMGVVYTELKMDERAAKHLEKAVQILPYDYHSHNNLGIVYGRLGRFERAIHELQIAMQLRPNDDTFRINQSVIYLREGEFQKAEETLKSLLAKNPRNTNLNYRLFLVYKEKGDYRAAISELEKLIEASPETVHFYEELGNIYLSHLKDTKKAKFYFSEGVRKAAKENPKREEMRWMIQDIER